MNDSYIAIHRERDRRPLRFIAFGIAAILVFGLLTTRLAYLQITKGTALAAQAETQRAVEVAIPAPRGLIYDRRGRLLVSNVATWTVKIKPSDLPFSRRDDAAGAGYIDEDTALFQRIADVEGVFNRIVVYRRNSLHSGRIDNIRVPPPDPINGRLSINSFIDLVR